MSRIIVTGLNKKEDDLMKQLESVFGEMPNSKLVMKASWKLVEQITELKSLRDELNSTRANLEAVKQKHESLKKEVCDYFSLLNNDAKERPLRQKERIEWGKDVESEVNI